MTRSLTAPLMPCGLMYTPEPTCVYISTLTNASAT